MNKLRIGGAAVALIALAIAAGTAAGAVDIGSSPISTFNFEIRPAKIPRTQRTHVQISLSGRYKTSDGSHVPALRQLKLEGDEHLALDLKGVPVCRGAHFDYRGALEDACRDSAIGHGDVEIEVQIAEMLVQVTGTLTLYKGAPKTDGRSIIGNLVVPAPVTAEIGIPILIRKLDGGRFSWRATATVPKIAGGAGSITGYSVWIGKRFLTANCGAGRLRLRAVSHFADGTKLTGTTLRACAVAEPHVRE